MPPEPVNPNLIECQGCRKMVSRRADNCPSCGEKRPELIRCAVCKEEILKTLTVCPCCGDPTPFDGVGINGKSALASCNSCGHKVSPRTSVCPSCSKKMTSKCVACGSLILTDSLVCSKCGDPKPFDQSGLIEPKRSLPELESIIEQQEAPKADNTQDKPNQPPKSLPLTGTQKDYCDGSCLGVTGENGLCRACGKKRSPKKSVGQTSTVPNSNRSPTAPSRPQGESKRWSVYESPKTNTPTELIKDGFSWPAFFFMGFWTLTKRMWGVSVAIIILSMFINGFSKTADFDNHGVILFYIVLCLSINYCFAYFANNLWVNNLIKRGYTFSHFSYGKDKKEATRNINKYS